MRTWRQGVVGRVTAPGQPDFFLRCLLYPLAQTFSRFDPGSGVLTGPRGLIRVRLQDFAAIERVGEVKLTAADRRIEPDGAPWSAWGPETDSSSSLIHS